MAGLKDQQTAENIVIKFSGFFEGPMTFLMVVPVPSKSHPCHLQKNFSVQGNQIFSKLIVLERLEKKIKSKQYISFISILVLWDTNTFNLK